MSQTGFQIQCWARASASANEPLQDVGGVYAACFRHYSYFSPVDTQATCAASGYFNTVAFDLTTGDFIEIYSLTEGTLVTYYVTSNDSIDPSTTTAVNITLSQVNHGGTYNYLQVPLTLTQINTMYDTPVLLVPAPASNQIIVVNKFLLDVVYGSAEWTNGGVIAPQWGNAVHGSGTLTTTTTIAATALTSISANQMIGLTGLVAVTVTSDMLGLGVYLSNQSADFATGTGGSAIANIWYSTIYAS